MIAYLSGPITGVEDYRTAFAAAERELAALGVSVLNPALLPANPNDDPSGLSWEAYMRIDQAMLAEADVLVLLPGWERSRGSVTEVGWAERLDIPTCLLGDFETIAAQAAEGRTA